MGREREVEAKDINCCLTPFSLLLSADTEEINSMAKRDMMDPSRKVRKQTPIKPSVEVKLTVICKENKNNDHLLYSKNMI